ncbi:hypothetical protein [Deinococcus pimensis]|uniref:hypothetical protein n=1 Tax=Deinococcus pimensis TaxID=309888 RepID=UPI0004B7DD8E|nr:hypothetical protein [Deinococcus pimensis]
MDALLIRLKDADARERNVERLVRSVAGSLGVAGHEVSPAAVREYLRAREREDARH